VQASLKLELRLRSYEGLKLTDLKIIKIKRQGPNLNYKKLYTDLNVKLEGLKHNFEKV
jgi:hypothetical protein